MADWSRVITNPLTFMVLKKEKENPYLAVYSHHSML
jgi:hypothetical protein